MTYIGIDLGTSSVKTLLMAADGRVLGRAGRSYPVIYPRPGWSEQDPDLWIAAVKEALGELLAGQQSRHSLRPQWQRRLLREGLGQQAQRFTGDLQGAAFQVEIFQQAIAAARVQHLFGQRQQAR